MTVSRRARWLRYLLIVAIVGTLAVVSLPFIGSSVGRWLVLTDRLEPARAIVVLSGHVPFRAVWAATLYKEGLSSEVWISRPVRTAEERAMRHLGLDVSTEEERNQRVLERLGVPSGAIRVLNPGVLNTMEEVEVIAREVRRAGGERVIVVTSGAHTRRVKATWRTRVGDAPQLIVQHPVDEPFDPDHWWRRTRDALDVSREVFGLVNVWAGFPVRPDRSAADDDRGQRLSER
jgi:uncharacterized SAM-binding protein YcdF (DUF218 family)